MPLDMIQSVTNPIGHFLKNLSEKIRYVFKTGFLGDENANIIGSYAY